MSGIFLEVVNQSRKEAKLTILQGKTVGFNIVVKDGDGVITDVTGYDAKLCIKESLTDAASIADFTVANSRVVIGTTDGLIQFSMTAADSAALAELRGGYFEVEITSLAGVVERGLYGRCDIAAEVCT